MATTITINKINYGNPASGPQTWTIKYKKSDALSFTTKTTSATDDGAGTLLSPVVINGLVSGGLYYVQATNNCQSPVEIYQQAIQL
jgi:hypothetical protein